LLRDGNGISGKVEVAVGNHPLSTSVLVVLSDINKLWPLIHKAMQLSGLYQDWYLAPGQIQVWFDLVKM